MYKLLIVDDEFFIRDCLATTIPWAEIDVEVVGTAIDGDDAKKKVELLSPDIVITDVRMDNVDGLDLADMLRQEYPFIKVIIMSGYDDFEYIKRALEIKVFTYILKPVLEAELLEAVKNVIEVIEKEEKLQARIRFMEHEIDRDKDLLLDRFLYDILNGNIEGSDNLLVSMNFLNIQFSRNYYTCILISIPEYYDLIKKYGIRKIHTLKLSIRELIHNMLSDYETWTFMGDDGSLKLIIGNNSFLVSKFWNSFITELEQVTVYISKLLDITVTMAIGGVYKDLLDLPRSLEEAVLAAEYNSLSANASIVHINDFSISNSSRYVYPQAKESQLLRNLFDTSDVRLNTLIKQLFDEMESQNCTKDRMRIDILGLLGKVSKKAMDMGVDMYELYNHKLMDPYNAFEHYHTREQIQNWLSNIIIKTVDAVKNKQTSQVKSVIIKANKYLQENYADPNLTLEVISQHLFLNPTYFSRLYKKETGENYVDALIRIRLDTAKRLLMETNKKISDISENVGYPVSRYFYSIFKKYTGLTPLEYREKTLK